MKLNQLGEYALIERIRRNVKQSYRSKRLLLHKLPGTVIGIGDDAAVISPGQGRDLRDTVLVLTTDILIEDTHFCLTWDKVMGSRNRLFNNLGYKALAANISDLSAMGAVKPLFCLIGLCLPGDTPVDNVDNFYHSVHRLAGKYGIAIVGGDTNVSTRVVVSVTLIGQAKKRFLVTRNGAQPGDTVYVSGVLGDSAAGLELLRTGRRDSGVLIKKHFKPPVRLKEAGRIARYASAMLDCSDGLVASAGIIARESMTGIRIDVNRVPVSRHLKQYAGRMKKKPADYVLTGGEDYELFFTSSSPKIPGMLPGCKAIGTVMPRAYGIKFFNDSKEIKSKKLGYRQFIKAQ